MIGFVVEFDIKIYYLHQKTRKILTLIEAIVFGFSTTCADQDQPAQIDNLTKWNYFMYWIKHVF